MYLPCGLIMAAVALATTYEFQAGRREMGHRTPKAHLRQFPVKNFLESSTQQCFIMLYLYP